MSVSKAWLAAPALCVLLILIGSLGGGCSSNSNGGGSSGSDALLCRYRKKMTHRMAQP